MAGAREGRHGLIDAPGVLDVGLEAGAGLEVGRVELLRGEVDELIDRIGGRLAVGAGGGLAGDFPDLGLGRIRDAQGIGEAQLGDALHEAIVIHALAGHLREEGRVAEA